MKGMSLYYISRFIVSIIFGALFFTTGSPLWISILIGCAAFAWFLWAPHTGRYSVNPELGITALRRDERTQQINDRAARNGFIVLGIAIAVLSIYFGTILQQDLPIYILSYTLLLGVLTYFVTDYKLRRS
jgi:hypothetical protein